MRKKESFFILQSEFCKSLSNPKRLEILDTLRTKEMTVSEIAEKTNIPQANLSQHLGSLRTKGLVSTRRDGTHVYYFLSNPKIIKAFDLISEILNDTLIFQASALKTATKSKK
ncbi:MAG: metalloregulator ArsR/SmtB family transcription factor [Acidobacteriota bacterium]|nr:metalloregulator ArsR/SmtB family transcription factor [Acidobacteriota bacterium]